MAKPSAYQEFRDRLLAGELSPGQFVTQRELANLAGVPLGTAREAIQKLAHESLLKVHPQRGIQITDITIKFIRNAFQLRMMLEKEAIREVAETAPLEIIDSLLKETEAVLARAVDQPTDEVFDKAVEVDWRMHDVAIEYLGNELVSEIFRINATRIRLIRANNRLLPDRIVGALQEHLEILKCCANRDPEGAAAAMEQHVTVSMNRALQGK